MDLLLAVLVFEVFSWNITPANNEGRLYVQKTSYGSKSNYFAAESPFEDTSGISLDSVEAWKPFSSVVIDSGTCPIVASYDNEAISENEIKREINLREVLPFC